jgi:CubicO group peptidase (beta-lactamase class C family)
LPAPEERFSRIAAEAQAAGRLPSVAAAVFRGGEVAWSEAIGLADAEQKVEATVEHRYAVASITKTFTAASIMQLRDEGKLDLDDPLERHLPEAAHGAPTIRRMLAHASGLQREPPGEVWETLDFPGEEELLRRLAEAEQVLPPASAWHYSNLAYALLGHVVKRLSGVSVHDYIREHFHVPLGLEHTTWGPSDPAALPYFVEPYSDALRGEPVLDLGGKGGESGLYSTVGDLARWGAFLCEPDPQILARETVEQMHDLQVMVEPDWSLGWGLGIELWRRDDRIYGGHTGGFPGFVSMLAYSRKEKTGAVVLTNSGNWTKLVDTGLRLAAAALEELPPDVESWAPEETSPVEAEPLLGRWWSEGHEFVFSWRRGKLEARFAAAPPERPPTVFEPDGEDRFRAVSGDERGELLRVVRDEGGAVTKLYWATYPFTRTPETFPSPVSGEGEADNG